MCATFWCQPEKLQVHCNLYKPRRLDKGKECTQHVCVGVFAGLSALMPYRSTQAACLQSGRPPQGTPCRWDPLQSGRPPQGTLSAGGIRSSWDSLQVESLIHAG
jgi:hypothetical protein